MHQLAEREIWRRYRNRERIPIGFLCSFAAEDHKIWYGDFELMRISYDGLWALYFDSQWDYLGKAMELVAIAYTGQLINYFKKLGISAEVLSPFESLSRSKTNTQGYHDINHVICSHKASPFCEENSPFYRAYKYLFVKALPHYVDPFYLADLIEAYDLKEEILIKTRG